MNIPSEVYDDLVLQAAMLHGHAQGLDVLMDGIQRTASPASNAFCPILDSLIERAERLASALENLERENPTAGYAE